MEQLIPSGFACSVAMAGEMYTAIANAYLWIVPNAGHSFIYVDPDKYAAVFIRTALEFFHD